jgi:hypothetical protein
MYISVNSMSEKELVIRVLIEGGIGSVLIAAVAFVLSRFTRDIAGRVFLVILLFTAAGAYFGFAVVGQAGPLWLLIELGHIIGFGVLGLLGLRGSAYWIAAGWALHPVWDVALHYVGPGNAFAPWAYAIACVSFDLVVAAYVVLVYGLVGARRLGFRGAYTISVG